MNPAAPVQPSSVDVLVVGAGPAGSAAARLLARQGWSVRLVDQHPLGRDKVCGDGLIPDAHRALTRLGLLTAVMAQAQRVQHVGFVGPRGGRVDVPGQLAVLPRQQFDEILARAAVDAGAKFEQARYEAPLRDGDRVVGAQLRDASGTLREQTARWTLLATGAQPRALQAAELCLHQGPSAVALRAYVHAPSLVGRINALEIVMSRAVRPGYGWIFPAPGDRFNIGVGVANSHRGGRKKDVNLRQLFDHFVASYAPAAQLMQEGQLLGDLKGAPMRCTLQGAQPSRPGLMVIGEAMGSTYDFTGEGIGKAMETALLAADALLAHGSDDGAARAAYERGLQSLAPKYRMYARANTMYHVPGLIDLLIWRAGKSERLRQRMGRVLEETATPGDLITLRGLVKLFTE